jgi:hypothetical protein
MPAAAQGSTVSFGGSIASLLSIGASGGSAGTYDVTNVSSVYVGSGENYRVRREITVTSIEPGTVTVSVLGGLTYSRDDIGMRSTLSVNCGGSSLSGDAFLMSFDIEAKVGELVKTSLTFQFSGA